MEENRFTISDGLMLRAIQPNRKIDVKGWIGTIDYIDRSIMTYEEMRESLEHLQKSGCIIYDNGCFMFSDFAMKLASSAKASELPQYTYTEKCSVEYKLTPEDYDKALKKYIGK